MRVYKEITDGADLRAFIRDNAWSGALDQFRLIEERDDSYDLWDTIFDYLEGFDDLSETDLNDIIWFDEFVNELLEDKEDDEEDDDDEDTEEDTTEE